MYFPFFSPTSYLSGKSSSLDIKISSLQVKNPHFFVLLSRQDVRSDLGKWKCVYFYSFCISSNLYQRCSDVTAAEMN